MVMWLVDRSAPQVGFFGELFEDLHMRVSDRVIRVGPAASLSLSKFLKQGTSGKANQ